jgi:CheY-like chemotaxis protein
MKRSKLSKKFLKTKKVLIVEDNKINMKVAVLLLGECGITNIVTASTGKDAIEQFTSDINLIILDIGLPDMNGIEVCRQLRARYSGEYPPIIACTSDGGLQEKCMNAGMNEYIVKPLTISIFKKVLKKHLV